MKPTKTLLEAAKETLTEANLGYSSSLIEIQKTAYGIAQLPGGKLEKFFVTLSDEFMQIYDDSGDTNTRTLAVNLLNLSKLAREVN